MWFFFIFAVLAGTPGSAQSVGDPIAGRRIAEDACTTCHAIHSYEQTSPELDAPHFEKIANTPGLSAGELRDWLQSSHPKMPNVMLSPGEASDVIEYLMTLRKWWLPRRRCVEGWQEA